MLAFSNGIDWGYKMARRKRAVLDYLGSTNLCYHRPVVVAWWSAAFPGFGHMLLDMHIKGNVLFLFEIIINVHSKLNLAMVYSFMGDFDRSVSVLDTRWVLIYIPFYFFCISDSYRSAVKLNRLYTLTNAQPLNLKLLDLRTFEICFLDKRLPWVASIWSILLPGLGQFYTRRLITSLSLMSWALVIYVNCHEFEYILNLINGLSDFHTPVKILDPEWLLFIPSIIFGAAYDAYSKTIDTNKLFEDEQREYLNREWKLNKTSVLIGKREESY
jgi:TM2 domain-containing membrane protein YozV